MKEDNENFEEGKRRRNEGSFDDVLLLPLVLVLRASNPDYTGYFPAAVSPRQAFPIGF